MKHIVLTIDERFVRFCGVTLASVMHHNRPDALTFHIVTDGLSAAAADTLAALAEERGARVRFHTVAPAQARRYDVRWESHRISRATFYRCMLGDLLPEDVDKALYLDSDLLVLQSIDELWDTDLGGHALAAVPDDWTVNPAHCRRLAYPASFNYVNAGVLLINVDYWRRHDLAARFEEAYHAPGTAIRHDQDLINALLHDKCLLLPARWNVQEGFYRHRPEQSDPRFRQTILHPAILHYSSAKPWQYKCTHPLRHLFFRYQDLTPWKGMDPLRSPGARLHRLIHLLPYTLKLKRNKYITL